MSERPRTEELVILGALVCACLVGAVVALGGRSADAQFLAQQRQPAVLTAERVARVVSTAPDPRTGKGSGTSATCVKRGSGALGNPWRCSVRYRDGKRIRLTVRVRNDGTYFGRYRGGGAAEGCCIDLPGTQ